MKFLIIISIPMAFSAIFLKHPMSLGFILLLQTIIYSLIINLINFNFWFSYIMFLIMIGGMLILFIYMTSIASNEKFSFSNKLLFTFTFTMMILLILIFIDNFFLNINFINQETLKFNNFFHFQFMMTKFFNFPNMLIFLMTIIYLLITLIAVAKISDINMGPLRQKN